MVHFLDFITSTVTIEIVGFRIISKLHFVLETTAYYWSDTLGAHCWLYSDYIYYWMLFWTIRCERYYFILGPGNALEKMLKQPWKTLDFLISEDVRTLQSPF